MSAMPRSRTVCPMPTTQYSTKVDPPILLSINNLAAEHGFISVLLTLMKALAAKVASFWATKVTLAVLWLPMAYVLVVAWGKPHARHPVPVPCPVSLRVPVIRRNGAGCPTVFSAVETPQTTITMTFAADPIWQTISAAAVFTWTALKAKAFLSNSLWPYTAMPASIARTASTVHWQSALR